MALIVEAVAPTVTAKLVPSCTPVALKICKVAVAPFLVNAAMCQALSLKVPVVVAAAPAPICALILPVPSKKMPVLPFSPKMNPCVSELMVLNQTVVVKLVAVDPMPKLLAVAPNAKYASVVLDALFASVPAYIFRALPNFPAAAGGALVNTVVYLVVLEPESTGAVALASFKLQ